MTTRAATAKRKAVQGALRDLCTTLIGEAEVEAANPAESSSATAAYVKINDYRKKLQQTNKELLDVSTDFAKDFIECEEFDKQCLEASEKLFRRIPTDHPLRKTLQPSHLKRMVALDGGGDQCESSASSKSTTAFEKLKLEIFDGRGHTWVLWKSVFENEVHLNEKISKEHKFLLLVSNLKRSSFAHKIALAYVGIQDGYDQAWRDLCEHYDAAQDLKTTHLLALRDISKSSKVIDQNNYRQLENLRQSAWSKVNALKTLGVASSSYESLALLGLKEALPNELRKKFILEHEIDGVIQANLEKMFDFLKRECTVLRKMWEFRTDKPNLKLKSERTQPTKQAESPQKNSKSDDAGNRTSWKKRNFKKAKPHSSMMQEEGHQENDCNEPLIDLN